MTRRFFADIKRGRADSEPATLPGSLATVFAAYARGDVDEAAVCEAIAPFIVANFVKENIANAADLFDVDDEVEGAGVAVFSCFFDEGSRLPRITAGAHFDLETTRDLDDEALVEWQEENEFLTDAVNFFWRFDDGEIVIADHEGASFGRDVDDGGDDSDDDG